VPTVRYQFVATGASSIADAFKTIDRAAKASARSVEASVASTVAATRSTATRGVREAKRPVSELERLAKRVAADQERAATAASRAAERQAQAQSRAAKRAADAKIREEERASRFVYRIQQRHFNEQQRLEERREAAAARLAAKTRAAREKSIGRLFSDIKGAAGHGVLAGTGGILASIGLAARDSMKLQDAVNRVSINARGAGEAFVNATTLRKEFEAAAIANPGVAAADIAEGAAGFVAKTGRLDLARRFSPTFATVASATGAKVEDISNAAADIFQKFDVTSLEEMREALAALAFQGKSGAFELRDAASQFARVGAAASRFGVHKGVEGLKILGGLTQIARSATGSPEQAATATEAMFRQLIKKSAKLSAVGADVFEKGSTSKTRDVRDILVDAIAKNKGSLPALQKIFDEEGIRAVSPLISTFNEARERHGKENQKATEEQKTAAGVRALREQLDAAINAPASWAGVVDDAAQAQSSASSRLNAAWESIKSKVAADVLPSLMELATKLAEDTSAMDPFIEAVGLAVEALTAFAGFLKDSGFITKREKTHAEKAADAQKKLDRINARLAPRGLSEFSASAKDLEKIGSSQKELRDLRTTIFNEKEKATGEAADVFSYMTPEGFAQQYAALNPTAEDAELRAKFVASKLAKNPADPIVSNDYLHGLMGDETSEQRELRHKFQEQITAQRINEKNRTGAPMDADSKMASLSNAAEDATRALQRLAAANQPSTVNGR